MNVNKIIIVVLFVFLNESIAGDIIGKYKLLKTGEIKVTITNNTNQHLIIRGCRNVVTEIFFDSPRITLMRKEWAALKPKGAGFCTDSITFVIPKKAVLDKRKPISGWFDISVFQPNKRMIGSWKRSKVNFIDERGKEVRE